MSKKKIKMGSLFMTFLMIIIGLALTPTVQESVTGVSGTFNATLGHYNLTGSALALVVLVPLFWVIIVLAVGALAVWAQFKGLGK